MEAIQTLILSVEETGIILAILGIWLSIIIFIYPHIEEDFLRFFFEHVTPEEARRRMRIYLKYLAVFSALVIVLVLFYLLIKLLFTIPLWLTGDLLPSNYWVTFILLWGGVTVVFTIMILISRHNRIRKQSNTGNKAEVNKKQKKS